MVKEAPKCKIGFPCGKSCISRTKNCYANLSSKDNKVAETFSQFVNRLVGIGNNTQSELNNSTKESKQKPLLSPEDISEIEKDFNYFDDNISYLSYLYEKNNYNTKPTVVDKISDLDNRDDVLKDKNGNTLKLYRGVTDKKYVSEFKEGDTHYAGVGIYGNGTYTAVNEDGDNLKALDEASDYSDKSDKESIMAMAVKKDSKIANSEEYELLKQEYFKLVKQTGLDIDISEMLVIMGYDGYTVNQTADKRGNNYMVILNRAALIIANQSPDKDNNIYMEQIVNDPIISRKLAILRNKEYKGIKSFDFWNFLEKASESEILSLIK